MQSQEEITEQKAKKQQTGLFASLSGFQKVLLLVFALAIFFLIWNVVFGGISNFYQLAFFLIAFCSIIGLGYVVLTAISWYLAPEKFSPKKDYFNRIVNLAIDLKPDNVFDLYFRGDKDKKRVRAGNIIGLLGIPYLVGDLEKDEKGKIKYEYSNRLKKDIPIFSKIEYGNDGDTFFVYESGWLFFKRRHYLRCHKSLHGDLNGDIEIYDINPVPYGSLYEYPYKQLQKEPAKIMLQNQMEVILATHERQYDLISQGVDSSMYWNPYFRFIQKQNAEMQIQQ